VEVSEHPEAENNVPIESSIPVGAAPLESILCTEELHRRPSRSPDHEKENLALVKLVDALVDSPSTIFQALAEEILRITECDSAGLSLLTTDGKTPDVCGERFYWPAIAGIWGPHVGGGTPRNFGPCGDVLDQNRVLLFTHFERRYPYLLPVVPAAEECLLVPFYVGGIAVGTIWAITHTDRRKFDAEDDRVMGSLGKFASFAYQTVASIDELRFQIREREKAEAALQKMADGLETQVRTRTQDLERSTHELLDTNKKLEKEIDKRARAERRFRVSEARARELANEQAALRRVATLVARESSPERLFAVVAEQVARIVNVPLVRLIRYERDGSSVELVGGWGENVDRLGIGTRWPLDGSGVIASVWQSGRPARLDDYTGIPGEAAEAVRQAGMLSSVASPIIVERRLWGAMAVLSPGPDPLDEDTEARLSDFTELVATAIANAESRAKLAASRARVIAAGDDARRRIERDLHDGAQQQLVTVILTLQSVAGRIDPSLKEPRAEVARAADRVTSVVEQLREISKGIHPAILTEGGLQPAIETLALRSAVPVELDIDAERRFPDAVEVGAYYVVSEALANAAKHADASRMQVDLHVDDATLNLSVSDDGVGGADPSRGSGLIGLRDRVEALDGTIEITSLPGSGTRLDVKLPIPSNRPTDSGLVGSSVAA
jgi:signal transduction histidine kinase